ncbi:hypothetical protein [Geobacter anodireducens]
MPTFQRRFSIVQKLIASYAVVIFLTTAALVFALLGLYSQNRTAKEIARTDLFVISATYRLRESLSAQDRFAGRYLILKSGEFKDLFNQRQSEFMTILGELGRRGNDQPSATWLPAMKSTGRSPNASSPPATATPWPPERTRTKLPPASTPSRPCGARSSTRSWPRRTGANRPRYAWP